MPVTVPLNQTAPVTLDASGNGTARVGPISLREVWNPAQVSVRVSTNANEAQCAVYIGDDTSAPNFQDGTLLGSSGASTTNVAGPVYVGQYVFAVWTGGDPGAQGQMTVTGTKLLK